MNLSGFLSRGQYLQLMINTSSGRSTTESESAPSVHASYFTVLQCLLRAYFATYYSDSQPSSQDDASTPEAGGEDETQGWPAREPM